MSKYYKKEDVIKAIEDKIAEYIPTLYGIYGEIPLELRMAIEHLSTIEVSEDCISREWLITSLKYCRQQREIDIPDWWAHRSDLLKLIKNAPNVVPSRAEGEWIEREDWNGDTYYDCSICGESFVLIDGTPSMNLYHYCPNCGKKMKGTVALDEDKI